MRIPEEKIEEIRTAANIVDIISSYMPLKKKGRNFFGNCPFHNEKTPSFSVNEDKQIFHCFGCHAGGNVFKFLMDYKSISFLESVQEVADSVGIKIDMQGGVDQKHQDELETLYDINKEAAMLFYENLKTKQGGKAQEYLKRRNIKPKTQKIFGLGYALPEWEHMHNHFKSKGVELGKVYELGLIDKREKDGSYYDKFRDRVIYPIMSPNGRVVAFGGRILEKNDKAPKYLNSKESRIYFKRRSLYGLFHSKDDIRKLDKAILVEGYMDVIALHQHGVKNVVAASGTALTPEQVQLLSRFTKNVVVIFDADPAGQKAAVKSIEVFLKQNFDVRVLTLPDGHDPDSYVNEFGEDAFKDQVKRAKDFLLFRTENFKKEGWFDDPARKAEAVRELMQTAAIIEDDIKRSILLKSMANEFDLRQSLLENELDKIMKNQNRQVQNRPPEPPHPVETIGRLAAVENKSISGEMNRFEKDLIRLIYEGNEEITEIIFDTILPEDFENDVFREAANTAYECYKEKINSTSQVIEKIENEEIKKYIRELSVSEEPISKKWDKWSYTGTVEINYLAHARDIVRKFRLRKIDELIKLNNTKIESLGNEGDILELMKINRELQNEKKKIINSGHENEL